MTRGILVIAAVVLALAACGGSEARPPDTKDAAVRAYIAAVMTGNSAAVLRMNAPSARSFALSAARGDRHTLGDAYTIIWVHDEGEWTTALVRGVRHLTTKSPNALLTLARWRFLLVPSRANWQVSEEQWLLIGSCFLFPKGVKPPRGSLRCPSVPKR